jgi:hypothetical protein
MSEQTPADDREKRVTFANYVLSDWDAAMDHFFERVERAAKRLGLTDEEVGTALTLGYGDEVGDAWTEWAADA